MKTGWQRATAGVYDFYNSQGKRIVQGVRTPDGKKPKWVPSTGSAPRPNPNAPTPLPPPSVPDVPSIPSYDPAPSLPDSGRRYGLDALAGAKFPDVLIQEFPAGWWLGIFSNVFGDARPVVQHLLGQGRLGGVRPHLMWKDKHDFSERDFPAIAAEARKWKEIVRANPGVPFAFSGGCENRLPFNLAIKLQNVVLNELPEVIYVNSGTAVIPSGPRAWNEVHEPFGAQLALPLPGWFSYSFDGTSCTNEDMENRKLAMKDAQVFFFWLSQFNLLKDDNDKTPRGARSHSPTGPLIDSLVYYKNPKGPTFLLPNVTWKSHAEESQPRDPFRDNKPLAIIRTQAPSVQLLADNGQVVASANKFRIPYRDGRNRYYFGEWGFNLAEKAIRIQGHPVCRLVGGGQEFGRVNPAFRDGDYK